MNKFILALCVLLMPCFVWSATVPESVRYFAAHQDEFPASNFDLSLCKLLARDPGGKFYGQPADRGDETCDLHGVTLAYDGWCQAAMEAVGHNHFTQPLMPDIEITHYEDGIVVYVNFYQASRSVRTQAGSASALTFLQNVRRMSDEELAPLVHDGQLPIFPPQWLKWLPPHAK